MALTINPDDPRLHETGPDGQNAAYLILSAEERRKGFVRPVRTSYKHLACGAHTSMGQQLAETYARDPKFYGATYCCQCQSHPHLVDANGERAFQWCDERGNPIEGAFVGE